MTIQVFMRFKYMVPNRSKNGSFLEMSVSSWVMINPMSIQWCCSHVLVLHTAVEGSRSRLHGGTWPLTTDPWPGNLCVLLMQPATALASLSSSSFHCPQNGSFCGFTLQWILEKQMWQCLSVLSYFFRNGYKKNPKYNLEVTDFNRREWA